MLGLLAAAVLQKPVVLPNRAMRLDDLLKELATHTGERYKVAGTMAGRIVLVAGPARPAEALRKDLAAATWGKWSRDSEEWTLDEDRAAVAARERARLASRIEQAKKQLADLRPKAAKPFDAAAAKSLLDLLGQWDKVQKEKPNEAYPFMKRIEALVPANVAIQRVAASLDPAELAALEHGAKAVYSNRPTRLQRPLPPSAVNAIRQLEKDQAVWARAFPDNTDFLASHQSRYTMDPRGYTEPAAGLRLVLVVNGFEHGQTMFSGHFVDKDRRVRQFGSVSIDFRDGRERSDLAPKVDPKEPKMALSPEAAAFSVNRTGKPATPALRALLLRPERRDPLDILIGEGLRNAAKKQNASVVAWLGDDAVNFTVWKGQSTGEFLRDLWQMNYEVREAPGSVLVRPLFEAENVDRPRLGTLARLADAKGYVPLDDMADYAAATPSRNRSYDAMTYVVMSVVTPGLLEAARVDWQTLGLWGGFSRAQRQALAAPGLVPWAAVPKDLRDRLTNAIATSENYEFERSGPGSPFMTIDNEPTEFLASGFAYGAGPSGSGGTQEGVFAASTDSNPYNGGVAAPWNLASAIVSREREPDKEHYDGLPKKLPDAYVPGRIVNFGLRIQLSPALTWRKSGQYGEFDLRQKPAPLSAMPETFRKQLDQALEQQRNQKG